MITEKAIAEAVMRKAIHAEADAEATRRVIPAATAAGEDAALSRRSPGAMWERPAVPITEEPLMTGHSLILPTTAENRWSLSAAQVR